MAGSACALWTCKPMEKVAPYRFQDLRRGQANGVRFSSDGPCNLATLTPGYLARMGYPERTRTPD
ncbi:hypothetical protein SKAU_G00162300 [Synaphobranchus kaupii]|uniref:Uncharacterized protein n=1 Tax=Synaphobranchus kaupii TaxID=118154 RepID=A0A9Q1FJC0_SYNKA|nr:hypothetical protein SKAU_G00162300 [Synaphobranchus kaupii]